MGNSFCKKISIIVPVYKVESCLVRCLDSLSRQSMWEIEIILVDDASPDRCGEICDDYAAKDERFKVIHHTENRGLSVARNTGIANSTGDYLMFVDSDDYVHVDFCKIPYECALRNSVDLVLFRFEHVKRKPFFSNKNIFKSKQTNDNLLKSGFITQNQALSLLQLDGFGVGPAVWNKLYHRKLFEGITFPVGRLYEDVGTTYKTVLKTNLIYYLDSVLYYHCFFANSITNIKTNSALHDWILMSMQQYHDLVAWGGYSQEKLDSLLKNIAMSFCIMKKRDLSDQEYAFFDNLLRSCRRIPKCFTFRKRILFVLFKYWPLLFEFVCKWWGKKFDS